jgi:hypothetical protein
MSSPKRDRVNKPIGMVDDISPVKVDVTDINGSGFEFSMLDSYISEYTQTTATPIHINDLFERMLCQYNEDELDDINTKTVRFNADCKLFEKGLKKEKKVSISDAQQIMANKICCALNDRCVINVLGISPPQSGKTGCMYATIKTYVNNNNIPIEHVYIITGLSSRDWVEQTRKRFPPCLRENIHHRNDLTVFNQQIADKDNVLIIMDEVQVAAGDKQTLHKIFESLGFLDKTTLYERDIKIVEFTATPDGTIYDLMKWGDASRIIVADNCDRYTSSYDLLNWSDVSSNKISLIKEGIGCLKKEIEKDQTEIGQKIKELKMETKEGAKKTKHDALTKLLEGLKLSMTKMEILEESLANSIRNKDGVRVKQFRDLWGCDESGDIERDTLDAIQEVKVDIDNYSEARYHIFRTPTGNPTSIENFKQQFPSDTYEFVDYDSFSKEEFNKLVGEISDTIDINNLLKIKPTKHIIVFVKEMLRCAKTTLHRYLGVSYERCVKTVNDTVIIQGILGRGNGYDDNGDSIYYTNIETIEKYKKLIDTEFKATDIIWNSNTTKMVDNTITSKGTYNTLKIHKMDKPVKTQPLPKEKKEKKVKVAKEKKVKVAKEKKVKNNKRGERVPVIIDGFDGSEIIFNKRDGEIRREFVLSVLKDKPQYEKLYNYVSHQNVIMGKVQKPALDSDSYKRHITDVVNSAINNKSNSVSQRDKEVNNWTLFIDAAEYRLCITPWVIDDNLY